MSQRFTPKKSFSMGTIPDPPRRRPHFTQREYGNDDIYNDPYDQLNGRDPIFGMTESEFLGDVGDK